MNRFRAYEIYGHGTNFIREERWSEAAEVFEGLVAEEKIDYASWYNLAYAYWRLEQVDKCLAAATRAVELHPDLAQAHELIGSARLSRLELDLSEAAFRKAVALDPDMAEAWIGLGKVRCKKREYEDALRCFGAAEAIHGSSSETQMGIGMCCEGLRNHKEAVAAFEHALSLGPDDFNVALALARALIHADGNSSRTKRRAERLLREVLSQSPQNAETRTYLALSLDWRKQLAEVVEHLTLAVELSAGELSQARDLYFLGMAYENAEKLDLALEALLRAQELEYNIVETEPKIRQLKHRMEQL